MQKIALAGVTAITLFFSGCAHLQANSPATQNPSIQQQVAAAKIAHPQLADLIEAAGNANLDAQFSLAQAYEVGKLGLPKDQDKAYYWYGLAATAGHTPAQFFYGAMHASSRGTPLDVHGAIYWYSKAAEKEYPDALYPMGYAYEFGLGGLPVDANKALSWYRKSADAGNMFAYQRLASAYRQGEFGLSPDEKMANTLQEKARMLNGGNDLVNMPGHR